MSGNVERVEAALKALGSRDEESAKYWQLVTGKSPPIRKSEEGAFDYRRRVGAIVRQAAVRFLAGCILGRTVPASEDADGAAGSQGVADSPLTHATCRCLAALAQEVSAVNAANGWDGTSWSDAKDVPSKLALVHSEVSEALEAFRDDDREHFGEEIADVMIRLLEICAHLGIDIEAEIVAKVEKNRGRGYRHGGKRA